MASVGKQSKKAKRTTIPVISGKISKPGVAMDTSGGKKAKKTTNNKKWKKKKKKNVSTSLPEGVTIKGSSIQ